MLDYYQILDINQDTPLNEIRKKYLILVKKYHPDLNRHLSNKEYNQIEEKFKNITTAYHTLTDTNLRAKYNLHFSLYKNKNKNNNNGKDYYSYQSGSYSFNISPFILDLANKLFGESQTKDPNFNFSKCYQEFVKYAFGNDPSSSYIKEIIKNFKVFYNTQHNKRKNQNQINQKTRYKYHYTHQPSNNNINNNINNNEKNDQELVRKFKNKKKDDNKSSKNILETNQSLIYNVNVSLEDIYNQVHKELEIPRMIVCEYCLGKGYLGCGINMSLCHICQGVMKTINKKVFPIDIREKEIVYKGQGNQEIDQSPADLIIYIKNKPNPDYEIINKYDLVIKKTISLKELYTGTFLRFEHLDHKKYCLKVEGGNLLKNCKIVRIRDLGLPISSSGRRGDLYIKLNICLPDLNDDQIKNMDWSLFNSKIKEDEENENDIKLINGEIKKDLSNSEDFEK